MALDTETNVTDYDWYAPDVDDNRESEDPFMVYIRSLTGNELSAIEKKVGMLKMGKRGKFPDLGVKTLEAARAMFALACDTSDNGRFRDRKTGKAHTNPGGTELFECLMAGDDKLKEYLDDIVLAMKDRSVMEAGVKKDYVPSSSS